MIELNLVWSVGYPIVVFVASLWLNSKLVAARLTRVERDIAEINKRHEDMERETVSRLRNIELQLVELKVLVTSKLSKEE
jgi:hypothetical protein